MASCCGTGQSQFWSQMCLRSSKRSRYYCPVLWEVLGEKLKRGVAKGVAGEQSVKKC